MQRKILIIIGSLDIGGTEKQLLKIIDSLSNNFDFTVLSFIKGGDLLNDYKKLKIKDIEINFLKRDKGYSKMNFRIVLILFFQIISKIFNK